MTRLRVFVRRWRITLGVAFAVLLFAGTTGYVLERQQHSNEQTSAVVHALRDERIRSQVDGCNGSNEFRRSFPDTLESIAQSSAGTTGLDLTALPEFQNVPPSVQVYLAALTERLAAQPGDGPNIVQDAADTYRRQFPVQDCDALRRRLERELPG